MFKIINIRINTTVLLLLVTFGLTGCGQTGSLYLPDNLKAEKLQRESEQRDNPALAKEAEFYRARHKEMLAMEQKITSLKEEAKQLRKDGNVSEAEVIETEYKSLQVKIGQLRLSQQLGK